MPAPCLTEDEVARYVEHAVDEAERRRIDAHVDECEPCRRLLGAAAAISLSKTLPASAPAMSAPAALQAGVRLGRYIVLDKLGAGAMGVVYAAYDPELDRRIALKLVRAEAERGESSAGARSRLMTEAQTIARLSHPSVITVYDVGTVGDRVFIAMELVDGGTLTAWRAARPRGRAEILELFLRAGEGLAAAHEAGVVHRDFKPDNVLVGKDGRPRVTDFGLAHGGAAAAATGEIVGTPAYMAPEQFRGEPADARADQFAFCVALWEALAGSRPYHGTSSEALRQASESGKPEERPPASALPTWIRRILLRGLRPVAHDRFPDMRALLAALRANPGRLVTRVAVAISIAAVAAAAGIAWRGNRQAAESMCRGSDAQLAGVWDPSRRAALTAKFAQSPLAYAKTTATSVAGALDARAQAWQAMSASSCEATRVRRDQTEDMMERRAVCLDDRKKELHALTDLLIDADAALIDRATQSVSGLTPLDGCADLRALTARVRPPQDPATIARVEAVKVELASVRALELAGRYEAARTKAIQALSAARAVSYAPLSADAAYLNGHVAMVLGQLPEAEALLVEATVLAERGGDDEELAWALSSLAQLKGIMGDATREALVYSSLAEAAHDRLGGDETVLMTVFDNRATILNKLGKLDEAAAVQERTRLLCRKLSGPESLCMVQADVDLANIYAAQGRVEQARLQTAHALDVQVRLLGEDHPDTNTARVNLGGLLVMLGRFAEARPILERGLQLREKQLGTDHPWTATARINLGEAVAGLGDPERSTKLNRSALSILEAAAGKDNPLLCEPLVNLARDAAQQGRTAEAQALLERALAIHVAAKSTPTEAAPARFELAKLLRDRPRARALAGEAAAAWRDAEKRWGGENGAHVREIERWLATK